MVSGNEASTDLVLTEVTTADRGSGVPAGKDAPVATVDPGGGLALICVAVNGGTGVDVATGAGKARSVLGVDVAAVKATSLDAGNGG